MARLYCAALYCSGRNGTLPLPPTCPGNEFGAVHKPWESASVRFALTYPEIYEVGASNLGHIILYGILNKQEGLLCDRAYFPGEGILHR